MIDLQFHKINDFIIFFTDHSLNVKFTYIISHKTNSKDNPPIIEEEMEVELKPLVNGVRNPQREILIGMLNGTTKEW